MCSRESLSRRCVLVKQVPEGVEDDCVHRIRGVEKSHRHNELSIGNGEVRWIVLFRSQDEAEKLMREGHVTLDTGGQKLDLPVGGCQECIIPDEWVEKTHTIARGTLSFDNEMMQGSIGMESIRYEKGDQNHDDYVKMPKPIPAEKLEEKESTYKYVPTFAIPAISSPYSKLYQADSHNSHLYSSLQSQYPGSEDVKVPKPIPAEKPEEKESTYKYIPTFGIPAISSPYSQLYQSGHSDSHLYSSLQSQYSEEVEFDNIPSNEETQTYTSRPTPARQDNSLPAKGIDDVNTKISVTSKGRTDEDSTYQSINEVTGRSHLGHDEPPPLTNKLGRSESKEVSSSTYLEPVSRNGSHYDQLQSVVHSKQSNDNHASWINSQKNSPSKIPVNSPSAASGDDTVKTGRSDHRDSPLVPQRLNRTQDSGVSSSTYIEPVSTGQVQSVPRTNTKPDIPQPQLKAGQGHSQASGRNLLKNTPNSEFPSNCHTDSNNFLHNAENNVEYVSSYGKDPSNTNQATSALLNEQKIPGDQAQLVRSESK